MQDQSLTHILRDKFRLQSFRPGQLEAIQAALAGERVLLVQPTGWGKSLVYQMIAAVKGLTVVFTPLRALMRDQVKEAAQYGLRARTLNSDLDELLHLEILEKAKRGELDLLFIAPERLENQIWQGSFSHLPIKALVIDEAHCISTWGHDFRPHYRKIVELVRLLPPQTPVVAVTATVTKRVERDIESQLGAKAKVIRGSLVRPNFWLDVIPVSSEAEKLAWVAYWVNKLEGTGIVYCATRAMTETVATYLADLGIKTSYYHANLSADERLELENGLMENAFKVVVATNALGMGINKPDIRFIIHTEFPGSTLAYYQEIGRAGRDQKPARLVLLYNPEDRRIQESFINGSKPSPDSYHQVFSLLHKSALKEREIMLQTGLSQTAVRNIIADLREQGLVGKDPQGYYRAIAHGTPSFDAQNELRQHKLAELEAMIEYIRTKTCRMVFMCNYLGDPSVEPCGRCDNCRSDALPSLPADLVQRAREHVVHPKLHLKAEFGKAPVYEDGRALDYYKDTKVGEAIHTSKYQTRQPFPAWLVQDSAQAVRKYWAGVRFTGVVAVPSTKSGNLVEDFARRLAQSLDIPFLDVLCKVKATRPQKELTNRTQKRENLKDAFQSRPGIQGNLLVVDDVMDSGVTLEEVGKILKQAGAAQLFAFVLAKTRHSDDV